MTFTEAINKALNGDASGFDFLYNATKNNKYYLALKYVKNEETAKDVLQEAYIRAWKNLDKLKEPEKFDSWLSQIVVNTAKNELEKHNHTPLDLRVESGDKEEGDTEIFDRAVSSWENVPELEYTKEETRQLVHELIDSLSDEQRLVVIAFELEGLTTKEIAEQLGCSEATVKSRLRYGRNNIKEKAEELQKKGYKLYGIAPVALLLYLLRKDMVAYAAEPAAQFALSECESKLLENAHRFGQASNAAGKGTVEAAKKITFLSTKAGKAVVGIALTATVAGVAVVGLINHDESVTTDVVEQEEYLATEESTVSVEQPTDEEQSASEESTVPVSTEAVEQEESLPLHDEVGWSDSYSIVLQHICDNTLYENVSELQYVQFYGFEKEIYENLTEQGQQFEYALVDLDKDDIPEMLIRANTSQSTYNGMSYWIMITYQKSIADDNYYAMPIMKQDGRYPVIEGVASVGGSRIYVTMNESMDKFYIVSTSAANGDSHTYTGGMELDAGNYYWKQEEVGYYTWEQENDLKEAAQAYPVEIEWKSTDTPFTWKENFFEILNLF